jgi:glutamate synthase (ferredoxin)
MVFYKRKNKLIFARRLKTAIRNQNLNIIGWRDVPVDVSNLGQIAAEKNKTSVYGKNGLELTEHQQFNAYYLPEKY